MLVHRDIVAELILLSGVQWCCCDLHDASNDNQFPQDAAGDPALAS